MKGLLSSNDRYSRQYTFGSIRTVKSTNKKLSSFDSRYRPVISAQKFLFDPDHFYAIVKLPYVLIIRLIIYTNFYTIWRNSNVDRNLVYTIPSIIGGIPALIFTLFLLYIIFTCSLDQYILFHSLLTVPFYLIFSFVTGFMQQPYLVYRIIYNGHKLFATFYNFVCEAGISKIERVSRETVMRYYLMVNYLAAYKTVFSGYVLRSGNVYLQRHNNKMMDYKQKCFDEFYDLSHLNKNYKNKSPQHINIFHDHVLDIRQFNSCQWKKKHLYNMNTIFGVLFYTWKVLVFLMENCLAFLEFGGILMVINGEAVSNGWFVWIGFVVLKDILELMTFYKFIKYNALFKLYYFDNKILAAILKWKDKTYHRSRYNYNKRDLIFEEINNYYWDFTTRIACKNIIAEWINEINIANIIQSYMGEQAITLDEANAEDLRDYYKRVDW